MPVIDPAGRLIRVIDNGLPYRGRTPLLKRRKGFTQLNSAILEPLPRYASRAWGIKASVITLKVWGITCRAFTRSLVPDDRSIFAR